ncbi:hypothetical protein TNCV_4746951 [Trichonephila clavipes]|nr:hypothetical protein TNCV_4746951 [Trichonephila clavipes]
MSLAGALSTTKWLYDLARFYTNFEGDHPVKWSGPPTYLPLPPTSRDDLQLNEHLKLLHAAQAPYIYKHPCFLQDSNPEPTAQQSASLTTIPDGLKFQKCHL